MIRKNVQLTSAQNEKLNKLSKETEICTSEHIRRAIDEYIHGVKLRGILYKIFEEDTNE